MRYRFCITGGVAYLSLTALANELGVHRTSVTTKKWRDKNLPDFQFIDQASYEAISGKKVPKKAASKKPGPVAKDCSKTEAEVEALLLNKVCNSWPAREVL